jgi:hypothetical protein
MVNERHCGVKVIQSLLAVFRGQKADLPRFAPFIRRNTFGDLGETVRSTNRPADGQELVAALPAHGIGVEAVNLGERLGQGFASRSYGGGRIPVSAPYGFRHNLVDDPKA